MNDADRRWFAQKLIRDRRRFRETMAKQNPGANIRDLCWSFLFGLQFNRVSSKRPECLRDYNATDEKRYRMRARKREREAGE